VLSRNAQWLFVLLSLVTATTVSAAPTVGNSDPKLAVRPVSPASDLATASRFPATARFAKTSADSPSVGGVGLLSDTCDSALADIAAEFLKPPADFTNASALPPAARPLPAVPAALFMGLTGFLCVTLVRDRKFWLTATTFILWAGQTGIAALPQAASHLAGKRHIKQQACSNLAYTRELENSDRLRSNIEGTQYVGLLHHLEGIPTKKRTTNYEQRTTNITAINTVFSHLIQTTNCLVLKVRHWRIFFSPAFIFESIPRGPPISL